MERNYIQYLVLTYNGKNQNIYIHTCTYTLYILYTYIYGLHQWLSSKESACNAGDTGDAGLIPGLGRSPWGRHGDPLQYSCLENSMDSGDRRVTVHGVAESWIWLKRLSMHTHMDTCMYKSEWLGYNYNKSTIFQ